MSVNNLFASDGSLWSVRANDISGNYGQRIDLSGNNIIKLQTSSTDRLRITDASSVFLNNIDLSANSIANVSNLTGSYGQRIDLSGNNIIKLQTSSTDRLRITDASSVFLNNIDLSANSIANVSNLTVSRATPQVDASYNFTVIQIATDPSGRDLLIPSPYYGQACYILSTSILQFYNNGSWIGINQSVNELTYISGQTLPSPIYVNSSNAIVAQPVQNGFTVYSFVVSSNQYTSTTYNFSIKNTSGNINFLCVGGGAGAASYNSCGGGGAGGFRTSYTTTQGTSGRGAAYEPTITLLNSTTYTVVVGGGSRGVPGNGTSLSGSPTSVAQGFASSISGSALTIISYGGSPGCCNQVGATKPQDYVNQVATGSQPSAGCGGGSRGEAVNSTNVGGTGTTSQGYNGGSNVDGTYSGNYPGGGGGGAGSAGGTVTVNTTAGNGGTGLQSAITGTLQYYAGGGGGSTQAAGAVDPASTGGSGVGGNGRGANGTALSGFSGASNTGSGGGAGCNHETSPFSKGGDGSAGIVVIRIPSYAS